MTSLLHDRRAAWFAAALFGIAAPAFAMLLLARGPAPFPLALVGGPILAVGIMSVGMIGAAASGRLGSGLLLALLAGFGLVLFARALGMPPVPHPVSAALAAMVAAFSFAARGALFARSAADRGWWIALFVVAGEVSIVLTAMAMPDALPAWLLALLPAQWASVAIQSSITGSGEQAASSAIIALVGTAAATLLVARLWPRRWPYLVMFTTWLALSALVWHRPAPPLHHAEFEMAAPPKADISAPPRPA